MPSACDRLARAADRQQLRHEAALGADRHDDGVLDLLRLHQAEHLGAEILRPVGPADAAARHLAEAQMHAFDARRIDEDLVERPRQRQAVELAALELDGDLRLRLAVLADLVEIGADRRLHRVDEVAQDAVLVEAVDRCRARPRSRRRSRLPRVARALGVASTRGSKRAWNSATICGGDRRHACAASPTCSPANTARGSGAGSARSRGSARRRATAARPSSTSAL